MFSFFFFLQQRGLINKFKIPNWNLLRYLRSVESHYNAHTPYHNKIHAADVVQSVHVLLQAPALDVSCLIICLKVPLWLKFGVFLMQFLVA